MNQRRLFADGMCRGFLVSLALIMVVLLFPLQVSAGDDQKDGRGKDNVTTRKHNIVSHAGFYNTYEGSKTCNRCHPKQAHQFHSSQHYQWNGPAPYAVNLERGGKLGTINDFCTFADINFIGQMTNLDGKVVDGGCGTCHVGLGEKPASATTTAQLENIDCLICHSDTYKRKVEKVDGKFRFVPAPGKMQVSLIKAITNIQRTPSKGACLGCHAYAGGGCNNKRGDIDAAHRDPPKRFEIHMASRANGGAGLNCVSCHKTEGHRIAGRGTDLQATDLDVPVRCTNCHDDQPHKKYELDKHTARVDCTVCHIPAFARITSTDMVRDFSKPAEVFEKKRLFEPHISRQANVVPEYRFFNGTSRFYKFATPAIPGASGRVVMSEPVGDITDPTAKLFAFKHHLAVQARDRDTNYLIPLKMGILFQTGDIDAAIRKGASVMGWPLANGYDFVATERYMGIFHEVAPKEDALRCEACHSKDGRIEFTALGYTPRTEQQGKPLCASCHTDKLAIGGSSKFFMNVHKVHVEIKRIDCSKCHTFAAAQHPSG